MDWKEIATLIAALIGLAGVLASTGLSWVAATAARQAQRDVAELNAKFAREIKELEFRQAHTHKVIDKRIAASDQLIALASRALQADKYLAKSLEDDWELYQVFARDWFNALPLSIWLQDERRMEYMHIMSKTTGRCQTINKLPPEEREREFIRLNNELDPSEESLYALASDFIENLRHDYLSFGSNNTST